MTEKKFVLIHLPYDQAKKLLNIIDHASSSPKFDQGDISTIYINVDSDIEMYEMRNELNQEDRQ